MKLLLKNVYCRSEVHVNCIFIMTLLLYRYLIFSRQRWNEKCRNSFRWKLYEKSKLGPENKSFYLFLSLKKNRGSLEIHKIWIYLTYNYWMNFTIRYALQVTCKLIEFLKMLKAVLLHTVNYHKQWIYSYICIHIYKLCIHEEYNWINIQCITMIETLYINNSLKL